MKLNFVKVGDLVCPTLGQPGLERENQTLIENVLKCSVTSTSEQDTVMTLTVSIPVTDVAQTANDDHVRDVDAIGAINEWECTEFLAKCPAVITSACTHVGSEPRLCAKDRGKTATWRLKNDR